MIQLRTDVGDKFLKWFFVEVDPELWDSLEQSAPDEPLSVIRAVYESGIPLPNDLNITLVGQPWDGPYFILCGLSPENPAENALIQKHIKSPPKPGKVIFQTKKS